MSQRNAKHFSDAKQGSHTQPLHLAAETDQQSPAAADRTKFTNSSLANSFPQQAGRVPAHVGRIAMLGEISGSIVHELNQPLTAIMSNAKSAQNLINGTAIDRAELSAVIADIIQDTTRASEVIRHLRALLKKGGTRRTLIDPHHILDGVLELAHSELINRGIAVEKRYGTFENAVYGDAVQLQQLFLNIVMNAAEALNRGGTIIIATEIKDRRCLHVQISDDGPGLRDEVMDKIFESFFTTKAQGLGIGLSLARTIAMAHGGAIWATNKGERGATFHVTLPMRQEEPER